MQLSCYSTGKMRVVNPGVYLRQQQSTEARRAGLRRRRIRITLAALVAVYGIGVVAVRPVYSPEMSEFSIGQEEPAYSWPSSGSAALFYEGDDRLPSESVRPDEQRPSASTIKLLTALVVLEKKPYAEFSDEPIPINETDQDIYATIVAQGGSAIFVPTGASLSYRQALEALLLASANNIADKLASWAYGTRGAFFDAAKQYSALHGLSRTIMSDPSGYATDTVTSARDMLKIASLADESETIRSIVAEKSAVIPPETPISNTNQLLGVDEIDGMKTGTTDAAGAGLVASRTLVRSGSSFRLLSVVLGQPSRADADAVSLQLLREFADNFRDTTIVGDTQPVGYFEAPWGERTDIFVAKPVTAVRYIGTLSSARFEIKPLKGIATNQKAGTFMIDGVTQDLVVHDELPVAPLHWRFTHGLDFYRDLL
jgi:D-alanyl-D-alanine carboxypeptidase (penicillin-binding protein 5/6)